MFKDIENKIILELRRDGRTSAIKIADDLGISSPTVSKRINSMLEGNLITIKAFPNAEKLGYQFGAFICLKVDLKALDDIIAEITNLRMYQVNSTIGINVNLNSFNNIYANFDKNLEIPNIANLATFDLIILVYFLEWNTLRKFITKELTSIKGVINIETYFISETQNNQHIFGNDSSGGRAYLDEIDRKLIKELQRNGRPIYSVLAKKLGVSVSTISRRVNFLIKENIIKVLAVPNPSKVGYSFNAYVALRININEVEKICQQLSVFPEIQLISKLMNGYNVIVGVASANIKELHDFVKNHIINLPGILSSQTCVCYLVKNY